VKKLKTNIWTLLLALAFAFLVTALDFLPGLKSVPLYGFLIIPVVWVALWSAEDDVGPVTTVAVIVTILTMVRTFLSSFGITTPVPYIDRVVVVCSIWLTVLLALLRKRAQRTYKWINLAGRR
jgi:hypothetical protein